MDVAKMPGAYSAQILVRGTKDVKILVPLPQKDVDSPRTKIDYENLY